MERRRSSRASRIEFKSYTAFTESKLNLLKTKLNKPEEGEHYIIQTTIDLYEKEITDFEFFLDVELEDRDDYFTLEQADSKLFQQVEYLNLFIESMVIDRTKGDYGSPEWHIIYKKIQPELQKEDDALTHYKEKIYAWRCLRNLYRTLIDIPSQHTFVAGVLQPSAMGLKPIQRHLVEWLVWRETQSLNGGILFTDTPDYMNLLVTALRKDAMERKLYPTPSLEFEVSDTELPSTSNRTKSKERLPVSEKKAEKTTDVLYNKKLDKVSEQIKETKSEPIAPSPAPAKTCKCKSKVTKSVQVTESAIDNEMKIGRIVVPQPTEVYDKAGSVFLPEGYRRSLRRSRQSYAQDELLFENGDEEDMTLANLGLKRRISRGQRPTESFDTLKLEPVEAGILFITAKSKVPLWEELIKPHFDYIIFEATSETIRLREVCRPDITITTMEDLVVDYSRDGNFFVPLWFRIFLDADDIQESVEDYSIICTLNYFAAYLLIDSFENTISIEELENCFKFLHWPAWNFEKMWYMYKKDDPILKEQIKLALEPIFFHFSSRTSTSKSVYSEITAGSQL